MSSNLLSFSFSLKTRCLQITVTLFERKLSLLLDMRFLWSSARANGSGDSLATGDVNLSLEKARQNQLRRASYCSAHAEYRQLRQPRQQVQGNYVYADSSLQSLRFPVLPSLPREVCSCCSKSHRTDRGPLPYDPSTASYAPHASSPNRRIMLGKVRTGGKAGFDKLYGWVDKLGAPVNRLSNKLGAEAFWPTTLDLESDKAARILRSFCSRSNLHPQPLVVRHRLMCAQRMVSTKRMPGRVPSQQRKGSSRRFQLK